MSNKNKTEVNSKPKIPELSFTEDEVKEVADFINFVHAKAEFKMNSKESTQLTILFNKMHSLVKKMDGYIFEFKSATKRDDK